MNKWISDVQLQEKWNEDNGTFFDCKIGFCFFFTLFFCSRHTLFFTYFAIYNLMHETISSICSNGITISKSKHHQSYTLFTYRIPTHIMDSTYMGISTVFVTNVRNLLNYGTYIFQTSNVAQDVLNCKYLLLKLCSSSI